MKKLFTILVLSGSLISSLAMAKTEGNYIGLHGIFTKIDTVDKSPATDTSGTGPYASKRRLRFGVNYQHAFNLENGIFIAPEIFIENLETTTKRANNSSSESLQINLRYGVKANIGYDVSEKTALYVTAGYGEVEYESRKRTTVGFNSNTTAEIGSKGSMVYGIGANFRISDTSIANIEISKQSVDLAQGVGFKSYETDINNIRFGVAHRF